MAQTQELVGDIVDAFMPPVPTGGRPYGENSPIRIGVFRVRSLTVLHDMLITHFQGAAVGKVTTSVGEQPDASLYLRALESHDVDRACLFAADPVQQAGDARRPGAGASLRVDPGEQPAPAHRQPRPARMCIARQVPKENGSVFFGNLDNDDDIFGIESVTVTRG